jgi:multidrug transporter EmrE-like cation transporter
VTRSGSIVLPWLVFAVAAMLEVGGDAVVRQGLRSRGAASILGGCLMLAGYGLVVNLVTWDFSRLLGAYVAAFAVVSVLAGRFWFREVVPVSTWVGLGLVVLGGLVIQAGQR